MAQPQPAQQPGRGRSGTPGRTSRLASQSSCWTPQIGTLGSAGASPGFLASGAPTAAGQPRGPSLFANGWEADSGSLGPTTEASIAAAVAAGGGGVGGAATPYGSMTNSSSLGVLPTPAATGLSPACLALGSDRKLVPTLSGSSRTPALQQPRSTSQPRSAGRIAPGNTGWAPAAIAAAAAASASSSPRNPQAVGSPAAGPPANAGTGMGAGVGTATSGGGVGSLGTTTTAGGGETSGLDAAGGTNQIAGSGTGTAAAAGVSSGRQLPARSGLRPPSRRSANSPAGGPRPSTTAAAAAALAALSVGVVEPYGTAAMMVGLGSPAGTPRPGTSPGAKGRGSLTGATGTAGMGFVQGVAYNRTGCDGWSMPLRPNSASPLGPTASGGGAAPAGVSVSGGCCPPLPQTSASSSTPGKPSSASARRPLSAHQETPTESAQRASRISLTCISDVPLSPSVMDINPGPAPGLPTLGGGFVPAQTNSAQTSSSGAAGSGQGTKRTGSSLLVSLDGLPPGPSRLYEAITKQLEDSDVDLVGAEVDSSSGEEGEESKGPPELEAAPAGQLQTGSLRSFSGDPQFNRQPAQQSTALLQSHVLPQSVYCQPSISCQQQRQQQQIALMSRDGLCQQSEADLQLGPLSNLRTASFTESTFYLPPQPYSHPTSVSAYNPLQPNIRGRLSWTGTAPPLPTAAGQPAASGVAAPVSASPGSPSAPNRPSSPSAAGAPPSPAFGASYPLAPPSTPTTVAYRFPALAFSTHPTATLPPHVQALLQPPFGTAGSSAPRDQATAAAAAVLAAAAGAVSSVGMAAAVADLRSWFGPPGRPGILPPEDGPNSPGGGGGGGSSTAALLTSQRLPAGSATAAAAAAAAIAGRPYVVNKLRLNLNVGSSRRPSETEYYGGAAPSYPLPSSPATTVSTPSEHAGGAVVPGTGLLPPATGQRPLLLSQLQQQHLSHNQQLLAQLQQQRQQQQQQQQQLQQQQQQQQQQQLFQQQLALQQMQLQRRQQQKQPMGRLMSLAEALAAAAAEDGLQDYFISASAVGAPLDWEGGEAPSSPRRQLPTAWRGSGAESGSGEGAAVQNRPPTASKNDRPGAPARTRGGGGGGGGALRQQVWLEGSAQLMAASMQLNKPQLWVQNGTRPVGEAVMWLARIAESAPSSWESDGWHQRPCSRSYLEGLRCGSGTVEAALEQEELAAARTAEQQRASAAREAQQPSGISSRVHTWRPTPRPQVRSAGPRRRRVTSSSSSQSSDEEDDEDEKEDEDSEEEETVFAGKGKMVLPAATVAARLRPKPRPLPAPPRSKPAAPKPRLPALPRGRGRGGVGSDSGAVVDDE